jgi:quercetin dioxygenase-like cupin family protein
MSGPYQQAYTRSIEDPEGFWGDAAEEIDWIKKWDKVLDDSNKPFYRWFTGGVVNTCYNALDRHVDAGHGDRLALIYDSPVTGNTVRKYTFSELRDEVAKFAGIEHGDARAKILGSADGYLVALVEAEAGYQGSPHEHAHAEFLFVVDGQLRNQGQTMVRGDGYAAAAGSVHTDFEAEARSTYLSIFKL